VKERRKLWFARMLDFDSTKLVFVDETAVTTSMARRYGRCKRGRRLRAGVPHGHRKTLTTVGAIRSDRFLAQETIDGAMNTERFEAWIRQSLLPNLQPGDVVVMDNVSFHKADGVRELISSVGATLEFLPPYSPDMNPIEKAFSKLKAFLRKTAARTVGTLCAVLQTCHTLFSEQHCTNYFSACGYEEFEVDTV
jgi:transposase